MHGRALTHSKHGRTSPWRSWKRLRCQSVTCQKKVAPGGIGGGGGEGGALRGQNRSAAMSARPTSTQMRSTTGIRRLAFTPLPTP